MPEPITAQFVNALFSNDDTVRKAAAAKLGVRDPRLLEPEDYLIEVANRLGRRQARSALPRLQELLGHPDVLVRASAAGAVAKIDPALGLPMLEALLEEDNREVRSRVVDALCDTDAPEVAGLLSRILLSLYPDNRAIDPSDDWTRDLRRRMTLTLGLEGGCVRTAQPDACGPRWGPNDTEQRNPGFGTDQKRRSPARPAAGPGRPGRSGAPTGGPCVERTGGPSSGGRPAPDTS